MGIEENIVPGKILYLYVSFPHEETYHNKYLVVVGIDVNPLLLKINSKNLKPKELPLKKATYPFLDGDSYLDCGTAWGLLITMEEAIRQLERDQTRIKGELTGDHRIEVAKRVETSKTIAPRHRRIIAEALKTKNPA
jgi:hypothetical protein